MKNLKIIDSRQNNNIKLLGKLSQKKYRHELGKFAIENLTIIYDGLRDGYDFQALFITRDFIDRHEEKFKYLRKNSASAEFYLIDEKLNKYYSELDTPSGITAIYNIKESFLTPKKSVVYLNGINDPGNLGVIMRAALAFDFLNIVIDEACADIYNAKTLNAAKDSIFKLNIINDKNREWLKSNKNILTIYAVDSNNGVNLNKFKPSEIFCLIFGNESHGISDEILKLAQKKIKIEISEKIESLNVATAAGILFYKLRK